MMDRFCLFGYINAAAYRARISDDRVPGINEGRAYALHLLATLLMSFANEFDFLESSNWPMTYEDMLQHIYNPEPFLREIPPASRRSRVSGRFGPHWAPKSRRTLKKNPNSLNRRIENSKPAVRA